MIIAKEYTFSAGAGIYANEHNANFDNLFNEFNGNITDVNIKAGAGIVDTKLGTISTLSKVNLSSISTASAVAGDILYTPDGVTIQRLSIGTYNNQLKTNYDTYTKLLLHGDVFPFVDEMGKTVTNTDVTLDTTNKVFGAGSMAFNGSSSYLTLADSADWDFGANPFTIDTWFSVGDNLVAAKVLFAQYEDANNYCYLVYNNSTQLTFWVKSGSSDVLVFYTLISMPVVGTFYHLAVIRGLNSDANTWALTINGIHQTLVLYAGSYSLAMPTLAGNVYIGQFGTGTQFYKGNLDELRISKGIARWTSNFSVPTSAYSPILVWS